MLLFAASIALAGPPVRIKGSVTLDGQPVAGAQITVMTTSSAKPVATGKSNKKGAFSFIFFPVSDAKGLTSGKQSHPVYTFQATKDGLLMQQITLTLDDGEGTVFQREIGAFQERHEFEIKTGLAVEVDIAMVGESHFAKFLVIPGDKVSTEALKQANELSGEKKFDESTAVLKHLIAGGVENANIYYLLGRNAFSMQRMDEGTEWFTKTLELNPTLPGVHGQLGVAAHRAGELEKAIQLFDQELEIGQSPVIMTSRAATLAQMGRNDEAIAAFEAILKSYPDETAVFADLASIYLEQEQGDKAAEVLQRMEQAGKQDPLLWFNVGAKFSNTGNFDQAENAYRKALALNGDFAEAVRELGYLQIRKGDPEQALSLLEQYLKTWPDSADASGVSGIVATLKKNLGK